MKPERRGGARSSHGPAPAVMVKTRHRPKPSAKTRARMSDEAKKRTRQRELYEQAAAKMIAREQADDRARVAAAVELANARLAATGYEGPIPCLER